MRTIKVPSTRNAGVGLALATAVVSGVAVFFNGKAVRFWHDAGVSATGYTTVKNLVAGAILLGLAMTIRPARRTRPTAGSRAGLAFLALFGGAIPFVLFFEGLARASSTDAAFIHKTLIVWVALIAVPLLGERLGGLHILAIGLLVAGQAMITGIGDLDAGSGELLLFTATLLWAVEAVVARRLLGSIRPSTAAAARMAGGGMALAIWAAATGSLSGITSVPPAGWVWVAVTSLLLSAYVSGWYGSLARLPAVDVMALLVPGVLITALLNTGFSGAAIPRWEGMVVIALGGVCTLAASRSAASR